MSDFWISVCIVTPLVLVAVILLLRSSYRADKAQADALASRLVCPTCSTSSLVWEGKTWAVEELYDDHEEGRSGVHLRCQHCGKEFTFTHEGERFASPSLNEKSSDS
jgi:hypothetical protein